MPDHFQKIAPASAEAEQMPAQRIAPQHFLHLQRQAGKAFPHVGVPARKPHPHAARNRDHGSLSSPATIRSSASTFTAPLTITRRPLPVKISNRQGSAFSVVFAPSSPITAGTNPRMPPSRPSR